MKEIDLSKIFKIVSQNIIPILLTGIICAVLAFSYCMIFAAPAYRTTTTILVNNGGLSEVGPSGGSVSGNDISASLSLVTTCVDVLKSDNIYKELAKALGDEYTYYALQPRFSAVARGDQSMLIDIYTYGTEPTEIKDIANTFLEIAPTFISNNILNVDIKVLATADKTVKTGPRTVYYTVAALFIGAVACALVYIITHLSKNTIENEADFKARYEIPLLGTVPVFETKQSGGKKRRGKSK